MVDPMKKPELLRPSLRWPLTIVAECRKPPSLLQEADRHTWRKREPQSLVSLSGRVETPRLTDEGSLVELEKAGSLG